MTGLGSLDFQRFYTVFALNDTTSLVYNDDNLETNSGDDAETTGLTPIQQIMVSVIVIGGVGFLIGLLIAIVRTIFCRTSTPPNRYAPTPTVAMVRPPPSAPTMVAVTVQHETF
ncbi:hypothetical protein EON65_04270 [archaeon]|nr:MAG: hypothetical protein EON65_04270 [archaeon]